MSGTFVLLFLSFACLCFFSQASAQISTPLACHDPNRVCSAYLYYLLPSNQSKADIAAIFNVGLQDLTPDPQNQALNWEGLYIRVNCSCFSTVYFANASINVTTTSRLSSILAEDYANLAWARNESVTVAAGTTVPISLLCGCLDNTREYGSLLSYVVQNSDTLTGLATLFNTSVPAIVSINNISNENVIFSGEVYYLPINIGALTTTSTASAPQALPPVVLPLDISASGNGVSLGLILGIVGGTILLVVVAAVVILYVRNIAVRKHGMPATSSKGRFKKDNEHRWFMCGGGSLDFLSLCFNVDPITSKSARRPVTLSREMMTGVINAEKPVVYTHEEVLAATDHFKESNMLGQGAFGTVYYGLLRDQDVAVKRMKATITKEFLAEMKVLCKFHHTNLNELLGYASCEDDLFLVYEYAEHRAVSDRLHDPLSKGFTPLTWNARVQIALDTARGLEYIHEHTREHYVHRDVKTSNILLDGDFRAKVADFGLAKLVEKTSGGEASVTRIVGTFGYIAPEYRRDGVATAKGDVYAFGVVLFELITGQEAISKSKVAISSTPERRSLISIMSRALRDSPNPLQMGRLRELIDPNLMDMYPQDCLYKMAKLGQQCVEEDPILRPDMKYVVFTLSQILLSSIEWEATLAGNSQVFSGLIQGR